MAQISDFAKSSCFTYLTSPILAATRGGQAYEVPLHRLPISKNKTSNIKNPTSDIRQTILGLTNSTKAHTYVPDIATKWYACHIKQMQKLQQRELEREETARENENLHKQLLFEREGDNIYCRDPDIDGYERRKGGYEFIEWNSRNQNLQRDRHHIKHSSSDYKELMRIHEQSQNKNFSSQQAALRSRCNSNRIKHSSSDYEELMRIHEQSQNQNFSSQQVALGSDIGDIRRSKLPPKIQKKRTNLRSTNKNKNNDINNSHTKNQNKCTNFENDKESNDLVCRSRAHINNNNIEVKKCLRAHSTLLATKSKVPRKVSTAKTIQNKSIPKYKVPSTSPKTINVCCSKNPKKAISSLSNQWNYNTSYFEEDRESLLTIVPR